jgi:ethanolamine ammonia-lyase small subunit
MSVQKPPIVSSPWQQLRQFTAARIALGRAGVSQPTRPQLAFQLAHARARDAVHLALDVPQLLQDLENEGITRADDCLVLDSAAGDRLHYLQHPDSGRRLDGASRERLKAVPRPSQERMHDLALVVADGLSALAVARHAAPLLVAVRRQIAAENWSTAPLAIVRQGRVAVGDEVGELLGARVSVLLIGERPGLSSPDSLGIYLTWMPAPGLTDANRNCISNVRTEGLSYEEAAFKVHYLVKQMHKLQLSGVLLKDESATGGGLPKVSGSNFLLEP